MPHTITAVERAAALDGVDLDTLHQLCTDTRIWTLPEVMTELELSRSVGLALWRTTCNYLYGGHREWPPRGAIGKARLPDVGEPVTDLSWPPDPRMFPPPDLPGSRAQPRWRASTILRWAAQVGRISLTDLRPVAITPRGGRIATTPPVDISDISLKQLHALVEDDANWSTKEIEAFFGVTTETVARWAHSTRNRVDGGMTTWPPAGPGGGNLGGPRREPVQHTGAGLDWWPSHHRLLPPPIGTSVGLTWWRAGDVKKWGLETGRLLPDGTVVALR